MCSAQHMDRVTGYYHYYYYRTGKNQPRVKHLTGVYPRSGFDPRVCYFAMYGAGVYFPSQSCKSHQYTCKRHTQACKCHTERSLIVARVALGDPFYAEAKLGKDVRRLGKGSKRGAAACGWLLCRLSGPPNEPHVFKCSYTSTLCDCNAGKECASQAKPKGIKKAPDASHCCCMQDGNGIWENSRGT